MKKVDILADIRKDTIQNTSKKVKFKIKKDTIQGTNLVVFEDFSEHHNGIKNFSYAIKKIKTEKEKVRIGFFGDSFIEGDMLTSDIRDSLQYKYGGSGVGFVPITSPVAGFRGTVLHEFENFESYSIVGKRSVNVNLGIAGTCDIPLADNSLNYTMPYRNKSYDHFTQANLFYANKSSDSLTFNYALNDSFIKCVLPPSKSVNNFTVKSKYARTLKLNFESNNSLQLYGVSFENKEGIYLDNFGMRGNSGVGLGYVNTNIYSAFNNIQDYKLIVLQYGLNALSEKDTNTSWYMRSMNITIRNLKQAFPNATILLVSVSDRSTKINGKFVTIPNLPNFVNMQRNLAIQNKILFWNMYEAMGGEGTMVEWAQAKKPLANKDYTHLTFRGGKQLASLFCKALISEVNINGKKK
ncbi:MAG: hypothetical protein ACOYMA_11955 [Bacteroidia bacterium]